MTAQDRMIYEILKVTEGRYSLRRGFTPGSVRSLEIVEAKSFADALFTMREKGVIIAPGLVHFRDTFHSYEAGEVEP